MPKIITITNQKGGVGKTTTTINLAAGVAARGKAVLAVDLDPQGNCTSGLGLSKKDLTRSTYDLLAGTASLGEVTQDSGFGFDLVPCNMQLSGAGVELAEAEGRAMRLRKALLPALKKYDFVFIDCPPALDLLTLNGLSACDTVLIPVSCEYFSLEGLSELVGTIRRVEKTYNQYIEIESILLTMYDDRLNVTRLIEKDVKAHFKGKVYKTVIPRNIRLTEAPSYGKPVRAFSPKSKGAAAYDALAAELIRQNEYV